jgi:hypothetical protein
VERATPRLARSIPTEVVFSIISPLEHSTAIFGTAGATLNEGISFPSLGYQASPMPHLKVIYMHHANYQTQRGFSPPYISILLLIIIALVYFFGWIALVGVAAAAALMTLGTAIYDKFAAKVADNEEDGVDPTQESPVRAVPPQQQARPGIQQLPATVVLSEAPKVDVYIDWLNLPGPDPGKVLGFVTRGLAGFGQKELVFCLKQVSSDHIKTVMALLRKVMQLAVQGRRVDVGGFTEFGQGGIFGQPIYIGIGYARPHSVDPLLQAAGLNPRQCMLAIVLTQAELMVCRKFGLARVLARQGEAARFFPYPPWNDIGRKSVFAEEESSQSVFSDNGIPSLPGLHVLREGDTVSVYIARQTCEPLRQALDKYDALVLGAELVPGSADGVLVWHPGAAHPVAITARLFAVGTGGLSEDKSLKRLAGCFVAISLSPDGKQGASLVEDGFAIFLSAPAWAGFKKAVQAGERFRSAGRDDLLGFCTAWHG